MKKSTVAIVIFSVGISLNVDAKCPWKQVIDTEKWYHSYQQPEASMIYLRQVVDNRYLIYDNFDIVVDMKGFNLSNVYQGMQLNKLTRFIGWKDDIYFTRLDGFKEKKSRYIPITDMKTQYYDVCIPSERKKVMLDYDVDKRRK